MILAESPSGREGPKQAAASERDRRCLKLLQPIHFVMSGADPRQLPKDAVAEIAFAGRSNAGKSSAINTIAQKRRLAFVSKEPGRTQLLNLFEVREGRRLVDLPGYGYARVPLAVKQGWDEMVGGYLANRASLTTVFLVVDIRRGLTDLDHALTRFLPRDRVALHVLLAKCDKLSKSDMIKALRDTGKALSALPTQVSVQLFSSLTGQGAEEARERVCRALGFSEEIEVPAERPAGTSNRPD